MNAPITHNTATPVPSAQTQMVASPVAAWSASQEMASPAHVGREIRESLEHSKSPLLTPYLFTLAKKLLTLLTREEHSSFGVS